MTLGDILHGLLVWQARALPVTVGHEGHAPLGKRRRRRRRRRRRITPQEFIPDLFIVGGVKKKLSLPPSKKISSGFIHTCSMSIFTPLTGLFMLLQLLF